MTEISVVIPSRDSRGRLRACLEALKLAVPPSSEVIVIDRASTDGSVRMVAREFGHVRLARNAHDEGRARALNQGFSLARGAYVLLLSPWVEVRVGAVRSMLAFLEDNLRHGAVVPRLLCPDGRTEPAHRGAPSLATAAWLGTPLARRDPNGAELRRVFACDFDYEADGDVEQTSTACLLMRRRALKREEPLDEGLAPYFEEADLCVRIRRAGWRLRYLASAEALHHGARPEIPHPDLAREWHRARLAYYRRHFGPAAGWWIKLCVGWIVADHAVRELRRRTKGLGQAPLWPMCQEYAGFLRH